MIRAALLGSPVSHSLSPLIHNRAYEILGITGKYEAIEVTESEFPKFFSEAIALDAKVEWRGFSLTMPLKEIAAAHLIGVEALAKRISSANTVLIDRSTNEVNLRILSTDVIGFHNIFNSLSIQNDGSVAIVGGGGTARAALAALDGLVSSIDIYQRTDKRNSLISSAVLSSEIRFHNISELSQIASADLVINTAPSIAAQMLLSVIPTKVKSNQVLLDVSYSPFPATPLIKWAKAGGAVIDGLELLLRQGLEQIKLMAMVSFDYEEMYRLLRSDALAVINSR